MLVKRLEMSKEIAELEKEKARELLQDKDDEARKWREDARHMKKELEEARDVQRKLLRRVEVAKEETQKIKTAYDHHVGVFEKEIKRSRKEAFKSSSALVRMQEELKSTRSSLAVTRQQLELERSKATKYEQDAFSSQYKLVGAQEELHNATERARLVEEERDALKTSLKEEEIARVAAEGRIALPEGDDVDDDIDPLYSPQKSPRKMARPAVDGENKENILPPKKKLELKALQDELAEERRLRERAQDQVDFMKMECQFECCSCRIAEGQGRRYVHDDSLVEQMEEIKKSVPLVQHLAHPGIETIDFAPAVDAVGDVDASTSSLSEPPPRTNPSEI